MSTKESFDIIALVERLKTASCQTDARAQVKSILQETVADPEWVIAGMPDYEDDDVILFEDDNVSIWHCRFPVGYTVPAHDHQLTATIGVYRGAERNDFWESDGKNGIQKSSEQILSAGNVLQIGPNAIHSVGCASAEPTCGIHVYLGWLTKVDRSLFDVEHGKVLRFDDENYQRLRSQD